jgi:membrane-associated phospholipid phosphatase
MEWMMRRHQTAFLGLAVSALALVAFILLASVFKQESFLQRDLAFTQRIHAGEESALASVFDIITDAGKSVLIMVVLEVAVLLWVRRQIGDLIFWVGTIGAGFALNLVLRMLLQGPRPYLEDVAIVQQNTGFPSGHAMMSLITYGLLIYGLRSHLAQRHWLLVSGALIVLVLLIGYSRMFFGFHYLSDVVGGYAAGLFWLSLCLSIHGLLPTTGRTERVEAASG